jgi:hypothetical protein
MSELSRFLEEHKASEFGLAPVSKEMAIKMAKELQARCERLERIMREAVLDDAFLTFEPDFNDRWNEALAVEERA